MTIKSQIPTENYSQEILDFLDAINNPRLSGSDGDKIAQKKIIAYLNKIPNARVIEQPFTTSFSYINVVLNYYYVLLGLLTLITAVLLWNQSYYFALVFGYIDFLLSSFHKKIVWQFRLRAPTWGQKFETKNIIADISSTEKSIQTLVFLAHYDSISHTMSPILEGLSYMMGYAIGTLFGLYAIIQSIGSIYFSWNSVSIIIVLFGIVAGLFTFLIMFNKKGNQSQGTIDNATGTAQLYHLGLSLAKTPLKHTRVILVATGAEELGDFGTLAFLRENPMGLDPKTTKTIVVDSIGVKGTNVIIPGIGFPVHHYSIKMEQLAFKMLSENSIPLKIQIIPPFLNVSGDIIVCDKFNYETIWFTSTSFVFHTPKDTYDALDKSLFFQILEFLKDFTMKLDILDI